MNMTRYEKIDGREAIKRILDGEYVFNSAGSPYSLEPDTNNLIYKLPKSGTIIHSGYKIADMLSCDWYVKKPFDVCQAMRDKPDEWVGAYQDVNTAEIFKVGFDSKQFRAISTDISAKLPVDAHGAGTYVVYGDDLDRCIPIEEVSPHVG